MIGDVIFFKVDSSFISRIISTMTKSEFTHVGLIIDYDYSTCVATIIESDRFVNTRKTELKIDKHKHVIYTVEKTKEQEDMIVKFAYRSLGIKYDYLQILGLFISLLFKGDRNAIFNSKNRLICSELVDKVYLQSGIKRKDMNDVWNITPSELIDKYFMRKRS